MISTAVGEQYYRTLEPIFQIGDEHPWWASDECCRGQEASVVQGDSLLVDVQLKADGSLLAEVVIHLQLSRNMRAPCRKDANYYQTVD